MARPSKKDVLQKKIEALQALAAGADKPAAKRGRAPAKANAKAPRQGATTSANGKPSALAVAPKLKAALAERAKQEGLGNWKTLARRALEDAIF